MFNLFGRTLIGGPHKNRKEGCSLSTLVLYELSRQLFYMIRMIMNSNTDTDIIPGTIKHYNI